MDLCVFCGQQVELVHVHGHYQCPVCKTNAMPCCDSDNCDTNVLLKNNEAPNPQTSIPIAIGIKHQTNLS
jgi:hypothetical protein